MALPNTTNNSPSAGYIAWQAFTIQYQGQSFAIAAGNTNQRWVWWRYNGGGNNSIIEAGANIPTNLADDDLVLLGNRNGVAVRIQTTSYVDGELLVDGSVIAAALAADAIDGKVITGAFIQTTNVANRGIKFDSTGLRAWTNTGVNTLFINAATGSITGVGDFTAGSRVTGAVVQTAMHSGLNGEGAVRISAAGFDTWKGDGQRAVQIPLTGVDAGKLVIHQSGLVVKGGDNYLLDGASLTAQGSAAFGYYAEFASGKLVSGQVASGTRDAKLSTVDASGFTHVPWDDQYTRIYSDGFHHRYENGSEFKLWYNDVTPAGGSAILETNKELRLTGTTAVIIQTEGSANAEIKAVGSGAARLAANNGYTEVSSANGTTYVRGADLFLDSSSAGSVHVRSQVSGQVNLNTNNGTININPNGTNGYLALTPTRNLNISMAATQSFFFITGIGNANATALHIAGNGLVSKATSSRKYKTNFEDVSYSELVLDVELQRFQYKDELRNYEDNPVEMMLPRHQLGVIAEDVEELGLKDVMVYDQAGLPDSVNYDRFGLLLVPIVKKQRQQIADLTDRINALEGVA